MECLDRLENQKLMFSNGTRNPFHLHKKKSNSKIVQDGLVEIFKVYRVYTYISTPNNCANAELSVGWPLSPVPLQVDSMPLWRASSEPRGPGSLPEKLGKSVDAKTTMCFLIWVRKPTNQMFATKTMHVEQFRNLLP